ncbi:MAG: CRISPR-associated endonuclease Cas2 [Candidatus Nomurabacteria bacterium]|nr:CRISPR-associated endonuclease Cas2 [Candidatus Nomurabacteria bacterium]
MSIEKEILKYLSDNKNRKTIKYKGMRTGFLGLPDFEYYKHQTLASRCSGLKSKGYIKELNGLYFITQEGEKFLKSKDKSIFKKFSIEKTDKDPKDLLIIYDIPDNQTSARNWFRRELRQFHFIMIQRSVWVGPSPLPEDFKKYVKEIKLNENFKTFKLAKGYKFQ